MTKYGVWYSNTFWQLGGMWCGGGWPEPNNPWASMVEQYQENKRPRSRFFTHDINVAFQYMQFLTNSFGECYQVREIDDLEI